MACPRGQTTRATEAVSAAECRDDCPSGKHQMKAVAPYNLASLLRYHSLLTLY